MVPHRVGPAERASGVSDRGRPFGLPSATALVVANMIGAGLFTTSGFSLRDLGDRRFVLAAWVVGGAIALAGAVSYGRLARRIRESGGEYVFLSRAIHPAVGFLAGWVSLLAGFTGAIAFAAKGFEAYALPVEARPAWLPEGSLAVASIMLFASLHAAVLRAGLRVQNAIVVLKLLLLGGFLAYALARLPGGHWSGPGAADEGQAFSLARFAGSLVWISLSYSGFNAAVYVAGEVRDSARTVPRALILGTLVVALLYVALNAVFLYAPLPTDIVGRQDVAAIAGRAVGGSWLERGVRAAIALALLTSVSSMVVAGPRVYAQMARDRVFPRWLGRREEDGPPTGSIWLQATLASVVVLAADLEHLLSYLGFTLSLCGAGTVASLFVLRGREGRRDHVVTEVVLPLIYVAATLLFAVLASSEHGRTLAATGATVLSGGLLYALFRRDGEPKGR